MGGKILKVTVGEELLEQGEARGGLPGQRQNRCNSKYD